MLAADWVMMPRFALLVVKIVCAVVTVSLVVFAVALVLHAWIGLAVRAQIEFKVL